MGKFTSNEVVIYHDETKDVAGRNFKGHVLFFVPTKLITVTNTAMFGVDSFEYSPRNLLYEKIIELRQKYTCDGKLHFSQLSGKTWKKYDYTYRHAVDVTVDALRHKGQKEFPSPLHCKMAVIFYPKGADWSIYGGEQKKEQKLRHDETLLRMLLKGASHYLYDSKNLITIKKIITDGLPSHRIFDKDRIIHKLNTESIRGRAPLRDYVYFPDSAEIVHTPSNHNEFKSGSEEHISANLLQLADLLLEPVMHFIEYEQ